MALRSRHGRNPCGYLLTKEKKKEASDLCDTKFLSFVSSFLLFFGQTMWQRECVFNHLFFWKWKQDKKFRQTAWQDNASLFVWKRKVENTVAQKIKKVENTITKKKTKGKDWRHEHVSTENGPSFWSLSCFEFFF